MSGESVQACPSFFREDGYQPRKTDLPVLQYQLSVSRDLGPKARVVVQGLCRMNRI